MHEKEIKSKKSYMVLVYILVTLTFEDKPIFFLNQQILELQFLLMKNTYFVESLNAKQLIVICGKEDEISTPKRPELSNALSPMIKKNGNKLELMNYIHKMLSFQFLSLNLESLNDAKKCILHKQTHQLAPVFYLQI